MKNFPHQFNDLDKLFKALEVAMDLIENDMPLTDENFGEQLTREQIYTYRDKTLSIDQFLEREKLKVKANRGHLTVARDIRRFFELLGFIIILDNEKNARMSISGKQLIAANFQEQTRELWKNALMQLGLEGNDGEISHPYRLLLKIVHNFPGIETQKLMLALEAENDSEEEFERISLLSSLNVNEIVQRTGTTLAMAANAVKILPGIAEQLVDIKRISNRAYPIGHIVITEDEISTEEPDVPSRERAAYREVTSKNIARDPSLNDFSAVSIDISEAIKTRQRRMLEHQEIVRLLAILNETHDFKLFEGNFDCLATREEKALLYEIKTILQSKTDQEKQVVKGVGQLKFYKYSIVKRQMGLTNIQEVLVFSRKPNDEIINFCTAEDIVVIWREGDLFLIFNVHTSRDDRFSPDVLL